MTGSGDDRTGAGRWVRGAVAVVWLVTGCQPRPDRLAGDYRSTWGGCQVAVRDRDAVVHYPRGVMTCELSAADTQPPATVARCSWQSNEARGRARFRIEPGGRWEGTWGRGDSDGDGGAWVLTR